MLAIIRVALSRPYTFVVLAILIAIFGTLSALKTPTDIFPNIDIPVISAVWTYTGLPADDMTGRIVTLYERGLTTTVNDIEHMESQSLTGYGIVKIFFQPGVDIRTATAQVTSLSQTVLKLLPPGITPPLILNYNASTVPILQLALSSKTLPEQTLFDQGQNFIRPRIATVPGAAMPSPYGGKNREVQIDVDQDALKARGLSAQDVQSALARQNLIIPVGTQKIGAFEYNIELNNSPKTIDGLNDLPIKAVNGTTIFMRDVAHVRDGFPPQINVVHVNGKRSVLMTVLKSGSVSTLAIIDGVKTLIPRLQTILPDDLQIKPVGDQSIFVRAAISGVVREGIIAAALTSLMILLFLGSWRSTVIIAISIPLSILVSVIGLSAIGQTLNIMTLGGLALAVGILVDDATVTIENINWHLEQGKPVQAAILDGAKQIVTPALVSLLCICIVFVPMFSLQGVSRYLFVPMAEAVIFAMIGSFTLSRTLVPTMAMYLLKPHTMHDDSSGHAQAPSRNPLVRFQRGFEARVNRIRDGYHEVLRWALSKGSRFVIGFMAAVLVSFVLVPFLGRNFFPAVDAGRMTIHVRAPIGTRVEVTAAEFGRIEDAIKRLIPADELDSIVDNIGLSVSGVNTAYANTGTIGPQDGDIYVQLREDHRPTADYVKTLRERLPREFRGTSFAFLPSDIISQILNFGAPAPIDLQVVGPKLEASYIYARKLLHAIQRVPGVADARIQQSGAYPTFNVDVDRAMAIELGVTERDVTNSMVVNLAGSSQVAPTFWLDPKSGVSYPIVAQTPQFQLTSISDLQGIPITGSAKSKPQLLGGLSKIYRSRSDAVVSHYDVQPLIDIFATTQGQDLGTVASRINDEIRAMAGELPKGGEVRLRGQVQTMNSAFAGLLFGLVGAILLIYLLIVVNFQSWADPFVIITALPAALAGIVWTLFATHTTLSVPALTGAIMCMGVATANSILVVSFARERLAMGDDAITAALEAGFTRFRPVLMTALAMIIGMAPMALGLGEGGEQNAPLGRSVIGGLVFATIATLLFVPVVFSIIHGRHRPGSAHLPLESGVEHV